MLVIPVKNKGRIIHLTCLGTLPSGAPEPWAHLKFKLEASDLKGLSKPWSGSQQCR